MRFTLSWLKEFLETTASLDNIIPTLNKIGLMVESVVNPAESLEGFVVAEILSVKPHPNADRLQVCEVSTGKETMQVVCGDLKAHVGMKSVLARPGMKIPGLGTVLKLSKIRDVESQGMLCSLKELGLTGEQQEGIINVDPSVTVGTPYAEVAGLNDSVIELDLTPNRSDCLGVYGIARDLMAAGIGDLIPLQIKPVKATFASPINVKIDLPEEAKSACPVFTGRVIRNVKNGQSPQWLQDRLKAIGLRPISTLVDVTNFMTYHINRPLHAFAADKLKGNLTIRLARSGETIKALNDKKYQLAPFMTVIADDQGVCALGGIIGGEESACTSETTTVFLESAYFDSVRTARTGRTLSILSDSRYRFERGVDPQMVQDGLELGTQMILDLCGGEASEVVIAGKIPSEKKTIRFNPELIKTLGAVSVEKNTSINILKNLGFTVDEKDNHLDVTVPSWRHDIDGPADLVEEVIRIVGYDNIELEELPSPLPEEAYESSPGSLQIAHRLQVARRALAARGLTECQTWSFISRKLDGLFGEVDEAMIITNPISQELEVMRPSLLPNLLAGVSRNHDRGLEDIALFEVGHQYGSRLPMNQEIVVAGVRSGTYTPRHWLRKTRNVDVYDAKSDFFSLLQAFGLDLDKVQVVAEGLPSWYHPGKSGRVQLGPKTCFGYFGEVHPKVLKQFNLTTPLVGFELLIAHIPLPKAKGRKPTLKLSPFQPLTRDLAFILDKEMPVGEVLKSMRQVNQELITGIDVFDVYQGEGIPTGKKSVAFTIHIEPHERTLTDKEINTIIDQIINKVHTVNGGELRV
jgi:phenylalanyl-tRNA synthetase beta chain